MQISGVSTTSLIPMARTGSSQAGQPTASTDAAEINFSPSTFSQLVQQAGSYPDVRSELVDSYKARVQAGEYPQEAIVDGLTRLIGGSIAQMASASEATDAASPLQSAE